MAIRSSYSKEQEYDTTEEDNISTLTRFLQSQLPEWKVRGERTSAGNYSFKTNMRIAHNPTTNTYSLTLSRWQLTSLEFASVVEAIFTGKYAPDAMFTKFNNKFLNPLE